MKYLFLAALAGVLVMQSTAPAMGQNASPRAGSIKINKGLPDGSHFYKAPLNIDIIDDSPHVHDRRPRPEAAQTIEIVVPPIQQPSGGSAVNGGTGAGSTPGTIRITPDQDGRILGKPGFQSNVPARGMAPGKPLPPGITTGVHAAMPTKNAQKPVSVSTSKPGQLVNAPLASAPAQPKMYQAAAPTHVSSSSEVTMSVSGKVTSGRGNLLKAK